jgi:hypothetical protein
MFTLALRQMILTAERCEPFIRPGLKAVAEAEPVRVFRLCGISSKVPSWSVLGQGEKGIVYQTHKPSTLVKVGSLESLVDQSSALAVLRKEGFATPKTKLFADSLEPGKGFLQMSKLQMVEGSHLHLRGPVRAGIRSGKISPLCKSNAPASSEELLFTDLFNQSQPLVKDAISVMQRHFRQSDLLLEGRNWGVMTEGMERVKKGLPLLRRDLAIYDPIA